MRSLRDWARFTFGFTERVTRMDYARVGITLMIAKYGLDALFVWVTTGKAWTPFDYLVPILGLRARKLEVPEPGFWFAMTVWTLPFVWIGLSMSIRRAADAGLTAWYGMFFLVPILNYVVMLQLALMPSRSRDAERRGWQALDEGEPVVDDRIRSAMLGMAVAVAIALGMLVFSVYVLKTYPTALFIGSPIAASSLCAYIYNRGHPRSLRDTFVVTMFSLLLIAGTLSLFALEGVLCILMAMPLATIVAVLSALVGRAIAIQARHDVGFSALVVGALPLLALVEKGDDSAPLFEVETVAVVDAPPENVWPRVVAVSELPPPHRLLFELGIAYPKRARIEGEGVGAVRRCEFSTGAFVEPITAWDEPHRLAFDVVAQPPPMKEWSPYRDIHPPHLDGYFRTTRGEFRLVDLGDGRTRLEGRTWYELDIRPRGYWRLYADAVVHRIHARVLDHVKATAESARK